MVAGRYRLERLIAHGATSAVWLVHDTAVNERIALKTFELDRVDSDRLRREVRLARRITHRNVVRAFDLGMHEGAPYLTMEHVDGTDLAELGRARGPLGREEACAIALQICAGLAAAHDAGVVHGDLEAANIVCERGGRVVLTGFGLARSLQEADARTDLAALAVLLRDVFGPEHAAALAAVADQETARHAAAIVQAIADGEAAPAARQSTGTPEGAGPPLPMGERVIAVLPFRWHGDAGSAYIAEALVEEAVDLLGRTRGLRVLAASATAKYTEDDRDPVAIARALGVDAIVEGSAQEFSASALRITARLIDAATGTRQWSERFDVQARDVLEVPETIAMRVAEALRVELGAREHHGEVPAEAIELYLRGRQKLSGMRTNGDDGAFVDLERCLSLAPGFRPAIAARAVAAARVWFGTAEDRGLWEERAHQTVRVALEAAADLPETQLAAAQLAVSNADFAAAVAHLSRAIERAPAMAQAHDYLASLELQAGNAASGLRRARRAADLDPRIYGSLIDSARHHFFHGRTREMEALLGEVEARGHGRSIGIWQLRFRMAAWTGDHDTLRRATELITQLSTIAPVAILYSRATQGEHPGAAADAYAALAFPQQHPRYNTFACQAFAEAHAMMGDPEGALRWSERAVDLALVDLEWLDLCPVLDTMRGLPGFGALRIRVNQRAEAIWVL